MDANLIVFIVLAVVAVGSAVGMLLNKNAVYSALFLILNFATIAVFYIILGAPFVAMTQVTVYAGAIMVLFLFVIMLLGAEELGKQDKVDRQLWPAIFLGVGLLAEIITLVWARGTVFQPITDMGEFGTPYALGMEFFKTYALPFEVVSVLLLAALVGAIVIARRVRQNPSKDER